MTRTPSWYVTDYSAPDWCGAWSPLPTKCGIPIESLSYRARRVLMAAVCATPTQAALYGLCRFRRIRSCGMVTVVEIERMVLSHGLEMAP